MIHQEHKPRIVWMVDESLANAHPHDWSSVLDLESRLVGMIGNQEFHHEVVEPMSCLRSAARQLKSDKFSCAFDLAGWLSPAFQELFPETQFITNFSMSRVRDVSSPTLETTGYAITMTPEEIRRTKEVLDLSRPLIIDDVSFSGWTGRKTMELWGVHPEQTTHLYLIGNTGSLGDRPGAVKMLEDLGSRVITGHELSTPTEDGWHLKDLHMHPNLLSALSISIELQHEFSRNGAGSAYVRRLLADRRALEILFPQHLTSDQVVMLEKEGKFVVLDRILLHEGSLHAPNPFLWASPYFQKHVDIGKILASKDSVITILRELRALTTDSEGKVEASLEFQREVRRTQQGNPEGQFARGKETL